METVIPVSDQENVGGKSRNSMKTNGKQSDRPALRTLQPHNTRLTGGGTSQALTSAAGMHTGKKNIARIRSKVKSSLNGIAAGHKKHTEVVEKTLDKGVQTDVATCTSPDYSMCTAEEPPVEYWQVLAEQRRQALADTLQENEELYTENETLRQKIAELERRLESKQYFAMMYKIVCGDNTKES